MYLLSNASSYRYGTKREIEGKYFTMHNGNVRTTRTINVNTGIIVPVQVTAMYREVANKKHMDMRARKFKITYFRVPVV